MDFRDRRPCECIHPSVSPLTLSKGRETPSVEWLALGKLIFHEKEAAQSNSVREPTLWLLEGYE